MRKIQFVWIALAVLLLSAFKSDRVITVFMIGDSLQFSFFSDQSSIICI